MPGTGLLDSEGLSKLYLKDRTVLAIDAVLAAIAGSAPGPVTVLTSDPEDISLLCGPAVEVIKV